MKFLSRLEDWINKALIKLGRVPFTIYEKIVPVKIKNKISLICNNIRTRPKEVIQNFIQSLKNLPTYLKQNQGAFIHFFHLLFGQIGKVIKSIEHYDSDKIIHGKFAEFFGELFSKLKEKIDQVFRKLNPRTLLILIVALTVGGLSLFKIVHTSLALYRKNHPEIYAKIQPGPIARRPAYHNLTQKSFILKNISIPFTFEKPLEDKDSEGIKSLILDIEIETSNRYLTIYLSTQEHALKDYLNRNLEPILPTFPLTEEGKAVVRNKIREVLNNLIKDSGAKGEVSNIYILNITIS